MQLFQQLTALVEPHESAIEDQIDESSLIRTLDQFRRYTIRDIADFTFLHFLTMLILWDEPADKGDGEVIAIGHATRTIFQPDFKRLTFLGTDLYVYIHLILGHNADRLKKYSKSDQFFKRCNLTGRDFRNILIDIKNNRADPTKIFRFLLLLEKNLQIENSNFRSCRRMIMRWPELDTYNRKLVVTRILIALRARSSNCDILVHLNAYAERRAAETALLVTHNQVLVETPNKNIPFSDMELERISKILTGLKERNRESVSVKALGFAGEEDDVPEWITGELRFGSKNKKITKKVVQASLSQIYAQQQEGVGVENMEAVLANWDSTELPDAIALPGNMFMLVDGHHRLSLQRLAGRTQYLINVEYNGVHSRKYETSRFGGNQQ